MPKQAESEKCLLGTGYLINEPKAEQTWTCIV